MSDELVVPVFVPSLVSILLRRENDKGAPLTEAEVCAIRDKAVCVMVPVSNAANMAASRGYNDVDPEQCWDAWQRVRQQLHQA